MPDYNELLAQGLEGVAVSDDDQPIEDSSLNNDVTEIPTISGETTETDNLIDTPVEETTVTDTPVTETEVSTTETVAKTTTETVAEEAATAQKTLEELLAEKSEGKFKSYEDVERLLTPEDQFANPYIKELNELAKKGVEFNSEFWDMQGKDYTSIKDPEDLLIEGMKNSGDYDGFDKEDLLLVIDDKYKRNDWAEEGEAPTEVERLQSKLFLRDSEKVRKDLIAKQASLKLGSPTDPKVAEQKAAQAAQAEANVKAWEQQVNETVGKIEKLSFIIDEKNKQSFDYEASDSDRAETLSMMKELGSNPLALFDRFKNEDGSYNTKAIAEMDLQNKNMDKIVKVIYENAMAKGAEKEVKDLKNINFDKNSGNPVSQQVNHNADALRKAKQ